MNAKCRFGLLIVLLFVTLLVRVQTVLAQDEAVVSPEILAAMKSFDQKYFLPNYIAYSGIDPGAQQALAFRHLEDNEHKGLDPGGIASQVPVTDTIDGLVAQLAQEEINKAQNYGWVVPDALVSSELEDYDDNGLTPVGVASQVPVTGTIDGLVAQRALEEFYKAQNYGLNSQEEMDFAHVECWDRKFYLPGHVVCPDGPVAGEAVRPGS